MCFISIAVKPDILKGFFSFSFLHLRESFYNINCYSKSKWNPLKYHRINYFKNFQWIWISLSWIKVSRMIFYDMNIKKLHTICGIVVRFILFTDWKKSFLTRNSLKKFFIDDSLLKTLFTMCSGVRYDLSHNIYACLKFQHSVSVLLYFTVTFQETEI